MKIRLTGREHACLQVAGLLAAHGQVEIITGPDGPYLNRRDTCVRLYLLVIVKGETP